MAVLQDNGYFFCRACKRDTLTREDFYNDKHKKHGLSNLCKLCESVRTRQPKHNHYLKSEIHKRVAVKFVEHTRERNWRLITVIERVS